MRPQTRGIQGAVQGEKTGNRGRCGLSSATHCASLWLREAASSLESSGDSGAGLFTVGVYLKAGVLLLGTSCGKQLFSRQHEITPWYQMAHPLGPPMTVLDLGQLCQPQRPLSQLTLELDLVTAFGTWKTSFVGCSETGTAVWDNLHRWVLPVMGPTCRAPQVILLPAEWLLQAFAWTVQQKGRKRKKVLLSLSATGFSQC